MVDDPTSRPGRLERELRERQLRDMLRADDRTFRRYVESLESAAFRLGGATRTARETRLLLDEALRRGWRIESGPDKDWKGGYHVNVVPPGGNATTRIHFPLPQGFIP